MLKLCAQSLKTIFVFGVKSIAIGTSVFFAGLASAQPELMCDGELSANQLRTALLEADPNLYSNIPVELRLMAAVPDVTTHECDLYRAAEAMNGALCVVIESDLGDDTESIVTPAASYGDNAVDRFVRFPLSVPDGLISCERATQLYRDTVTSTFLPVETNPKGGKVCIRDVEQAPHELFIEESVVRNEAGTETSLGFTEGDPSGCFELDESFPPGRYEVLSMSIGTSLGSVVELGRTNDFVQLGPSLDVVWFLQLGGEGDDLGTLGDPFTSYASFNAAQGTSGGPQPGDFIYALENMGFSSDGPLILLDDQWLVGSTADLVASLADYGVILPPGSPLNDVFPTQNPPSMSAFEEPALVLARDNTLRHLDLGSAFSPVLAGDNLGSLTGFNLTLTGNNGGIARFSNMRLNLNITDGYAGGGFGSNGIDLRNTTGRFTLAGGEIQVFDDVPEVADLGYGVFLSNAEEVTLLNLVINQASRKGILGVNVASFTLRDSSISNEFGSNLMEDGVYLDRPTGFVEITRVSVADSRDSNITIDNVGGSVFAQFSDLQLGTTDSSVRTNLQVFGRSESDTVLELSNSILRGAIRNGVDCAVQGGASFSCHLADLDIQKNRPARFVPGIRRDAVLVRSLPEGPLDSGEFNMRYRVTGSEPLGFLVQNRFSGFGAVAADFTEGAGVVNGYVRNLRAGTEGATNLSTFNGYGIDVATNADVTHRLHAENVEVFGLNAQGSVRIEAAGPTDTTLRKMGYYASSGSPAIWLIDRDDAPAVGGIGHCLDIEESRLVDWDNEDRALFAQTNTVPGRILLPGYQGSPNGESSNPAGTAGADIATYLENRGVELFTFNPDIDPGVFTSSVYGVRGDAAECRLPEF